MGKIKQRKPSKYTEEGLRQALKAINTGRSLRTVSHEFNIPKSTLFAKNKGLTAPTIQRRGPDSVLGEITEKKLVDWIFYMSELGFPVTKTQLLESVQRLLKEMKNSNTPFQDLRPGRSWFDAFKKRHPELCERLSQNMIYARTIMTENTIRAWFTKVGAYLEEKNLSNIDASRVFNCDESGFHLCPTGLKVLANKNDRTTYNFVKNDEKECITTLFCGNAAGQLVPPMVMFNYVKPPPIIAALMPKGWGIGLSENGWMTAASFLMWVANIFDPWLTEKKIQRPIVLYLDGHSSHMTMALSDFCRKNKIEVIALPPNSTHITQPFDVGIFHPVKAAWREDVPKWRLEHGGDKLKRENFGGLLKQVIDRLKWDELLPSAFRATGLWPFSPDSINYQKHFPKNDHQESTNDQESTSSKPETLSATTLFQGLEQNIDADLLEEFRGVNDGSDWTGEICHKTLFSVWRQMKNQQKSSRIEASTETQQCNERQQDNAPNELDGEEFSNLRTDGDVDLTIDVFETDDTFEQNFPDNNPIGMFQLSDDGYLIPLIGSSNKDRLENPVDGSGEDQNGNVYSAVQEDYNNNTNNNNVDGGNNITRNMEIPKDSSHSHLQGYNINNLTSNMEVLKDDQYPDLQKNTEELDVINNNENVTKTGFPESCNEKTSCESTPVKPRMDEPLKMKEEEEGLLPPIPSPFKKVFYHLPNVSKKRDTKKRPKELLPAAITSDVWIEYYQNKSDKKLKETEEKELKKQEKMRNRELKTQEIEAAREARLVKQQKALEEKEKKMKKKTPQRSPTLLARKRGRKKKEESKITLHSPKSAKEIKKEMLEEVSPPAKTTRLRRCRKT